MSGPDASQEAQGVAPSVSNIAAIENVAPVTFPEALRVWCRVGLLSFGGPTAQIAVMHQIVVEEKKWISESRFLHALNYCMLLPGPEAQQLATYLGWLLHGARGGLTAGLLFILPGFISILVLSLLYVQTMGEKLSIAGMLIAALFFGLKPAVVAIVAQAVRRIASKVLKKPLLVVIAALSFLAIFVFEVPFPYIILSALAIGFVGGRLFPRLLSTGKKDAIEEDAGVMDQQASRKKRTLLQTLLVLALWLAIWFVPLILLQVWLGETSIYVKQGWLFSRAAMVTFGGAYAVLPYIRQQAVGKYGWLESSQMLDGLGMAESTPGPLIMVVQFVGFLAAYQAPGGFSPVTGGILGSVIAVWATFAPCFLYIFVGAPYVEKLRNSRLLAGGLSAITAAVVGVVLNLALDFAMGVLFTDPGERYQTLISPWVVARYYWPDFQTLQVANAFLLVVALALVFAWKRSLLVVLGICCALGAMIYLGMHWNSLPAL